MEYKQEQLDHVTSKKKTTVRPMQFYTSCWRKAQHHSDVRHDQQRHSNLQLSTKMQQPQNISAQTPQSKLLRRDVINHACSQRSRTLQRFTKIQSFQIPPQRYNNLEHVHNVIIISKTLLKDTVNQACSQRCNDLKKRADVQCSQQSSPRYSNPKIVREI